ncbi:MAG TPA: DUF58 domain-containing protein, partial [Cytophagales bacterium]|nr:DUF58 domain-containing protein [Cytophagales bacterium]
LTKNIFAGEYHSAFKGKGMTFSDVRAYQPGDDIRTIDWKLTAKYQNPFVKLFTEERELTIILLIDVSASQAFGTQQQIKQQLVAELAAVLSFSAIQNNDKIGVIFFTDKVEKFIPPKKGKSHALKIIRDLIDFKPTNKGTNLSTALNYLNNIIKRRSAAFIISDFLDNTFEKAIKIAGLKHDLVALQVYDPAEQIFPDAGLVRLQDSETGEIVILDSSSRFVKKHLSEMWELRRKRLKELFTKCNIDYIELKTNESYIKPLMSLFKKHERLRK